MLDAERAENIYKFSANVLLIGLMQRHFIITRFLIERGNAEPDTRPAQ